MNHYNKILQSPSQKRVIERDRKLNKKTLKIFHHNNNKLTHNAKKMEKNIYLSIQGFAARWQLLQKEK